MPQAFGNTGKMLSGGYRYSFNGMETDHEVSGHGNSYTTQFRQYDPRLGRWKSLDPLARKFPSKSPFEALVNNPIVFADINGDVVIPQNMPAALLEQWIADLETLTGLTLIINAQGQLVQDPTVPIPTSGNWSPTAQQDLLFMMNSQTHIFNIWTVNGYNMTYPQNPVADQHAQFVTNQGPPSTSASFAFTSGTYDIIFSENQLGNTELSSAITAAQIENLRLATGLGMIFFHEAGGHALHGLNDENVVGVQPGQNVPVSTPAQGSGIAYASAADYENNILMEIEGMPLRINYGVILGNYSYAFYSFHNGNPNFNPNASPTANATASATIRVSNVITKYNNGQINDIEMKNQTQIEYMRVYSKSRAIRNLALDLMKKGTTSNGNNNSIDKNSNGKGHAASFE